MCFHTNLLLLGGVLFLAVDVFLTSAQSFSLLLVLHTEAIAEVFSRIDHKFDLMHLGCFSMPFAKFAGLPTNRCEPGFSTSAI